MKKLLGEGTLRQLIREQVRALMRETPGDAQYIELTGAMVPRTMPDVIEIEIPISLQSMDVRDDDPEEWSSRATHRIGIIVHDYNAGANRIIITDWEVAGVDGYAVEEKDAATIKAYLLSRPDILSNMMSKADEEMSVRLASRW